MIPTLGKLSYMYAFYRETWHAASSEGYQAGTTLVDMN